MLKEVHGPVNLKLFVKNKKLIFAMLLLFVALCAIYSLGFLDEIFVKDISDVRYEMGDFTYTGSILDGKFEKNGKVVLNDGTEYIGNFKNGIFDGYFTYKNKNGCSLNGTLKKGYVVEGELTTKSGKAFVKGNDNVKYINNSNWTYDGTFNKNGQNGEGTLTWADGCKYVGSFKFGLADKSGIYYSNDGTVKYRGDLVNGIFTGHSYYMFDSTCYEGTFFNGLPEGHGKYRSKMGWIYEGTFKQGVFDGDGFVIDTNGHKTLGTWKDGKRVV